MTGALHTNRPLPEGWPRVRLGEVCQSITTTDPRTKPDDYFSYVEISSINRKTKSIENPPELLGSDAPSRAKRIIHTGDVLVATTRPNLNAVALVGEELHEQICSTGLCVLRPIKTKLYSFYIYYFTMSEHFITSVSNLVQGAMYPAVTDKQVYDLNIPLPPLDEQHRIAARLSEQMAAAERARRNADQMAEAARALPSALLREIFPLRGENLPQGWRWIRLGDVCNVVSGVGFKRQYQGFTSLPIPFIKVSDMNNSRGSAVSHATNTIDEDITKVLGAKICPVGTVIFPKVGGAVYTNKKRVLASKAVFDNNIMGLVPTGVSSDWLFYWFQTIRLASLANVQALPSIKGSAVKNLLLPLPSLGEQQRIVTLLNEQVAAAERARQEAEQQAEAAGAVAAALLREAFAPAL